MTDIKEYLSGKSDLLKPLSHDEQQLLKNESIKTNKLTINP
jgi:hypothetical protein